MFPAFLFGPNQDTAGEQHNCFYPASTLALARRTW